MFQITRVQKFVPEKLKQEKIKITKSDKCLGVPSRDLDRNRIGSESDWDRALDLIASTGSNQRTLSVPTSPDLQKNRLVNGFLTNSDQFRKIQN